MRCLETSLVGEEIYNVVPFLFINYRISIWHSMRQWKRFLLTFDVANIEITCDQASQCKENGKCKDRPWSQVNEDKLDIERDSLPAQDIIQETKAELFTFFLVSVCFIFFKRLLKTFSTDCEFICRRKYCKWILFRRGSRITTDRFPKQGPRCKLLGAFYEADKFGPSPGAR